MNKQQRVHAELRERIPSGSGDTERRLDAIRRTVFTHISFRGRTSVEERERLNELIESRAPAAKVETAARRQAQAGDGPDVSGLARRRRRPGKRTLTGP